MNYLKQFWQKNYAPYILIVLILLTIYEVMSYTRLPDLMVGGF